MTALFCYRGGASGQTPPSPTEPRAIAWVPPKTTLDPQYVAAAVELLGNGLADPLGGRFCKMSHPGKWPDMPDDFTYGWLLPGNQKIVRIDGIEVKVSGSISPAVIEDVLPDLEKDFFGPGPIGALPGVSAATPALLLRVGKPRLAEHLANFVRKRAPDFFTPQELASTLSSSLIQPAISSFSNGDFLFARESTDRLLAAFAFWNRIDPESYHGGMHLANYRLLREDIQRRIDHPEQPLDFKGLKLLPSDQRLHALIEALDTVGQKQPDGLSGGPAKDPVVVALLREGDAAIPALIEAVYSDKRMSQTILQMDSMGAVAVVLPVRLVAWNLLKLIWPPSSTFEVFDRNSLTAFGPPAIEVLKEKWALHSSVDAVARWLLVLRDDHARDEGWVAAANGLVGPAGRFESNLVYYDDTKESPKAPGSELSPAEKSEASRLMKLRVEQMLSRAPSDALPPSPIPDALSICESLYELDRVGSLISLRQVCDQILRRGFNTDTASDDSEMKDLLNVITERSVAGDGAAATDYSRFFAYLDRHHKLGPLSSLDPFRMCPRDAGIQSVGRTRLRVWRSDLSSKNSTLARTALKGMLPGYDRMRLIYDATFRRALILGLRNPTPIGSLHIDDMAGLRVCTYRGLVLASQGVNINTDEFTEWKIGKSRPVGVCENLALQISDDWGRFLPRYNLLWSDKKRAAARAALIKWLSNDKRDWRAIIEPSIQARQTPGFLH
jgi:hypothetical protein